LFYFDKNSSKNSDVILQIKKECKSTRMIESIHFLNILGTYLASPQRLFYPSVRRSTPELFVNIA